MVLNANIFKTGQVLQKFLLVLFRLTENEV